MRGSVRLCEVGTPWLGLVRSGEVMQGPAGQGRVWSGCFGMAGSGTVRYGWVGLGEVG